MPFFDGVSGQVHYRVWSADTPDSVLVFFHGRGQSSTDYHRFGRAMRARGIEVWALDHVGHGLSEGAAEPLAPLPDLAANAVRLTDLARTTRAGCPVVGMGHSLGAAALLSGMLSTGDSDSRLAAAIMCGTPKVVRQWGVRTPTVPMLVVHGTDDRMAPIEPVREWATQLPEVTMREFPDAGHDLLHEPVRDEVTDIVAEFVLAAR